MSRPVGVMTVLGYLASSDWDGDAQPGNAAVDAAIAAVAELVDADNEYDMALANKRAVYRRWNHAHDPAFASDEEFALLHAADARVGAASVRRRDALAAVQGGAA